MPGAVAEPGLKWFKGPRFSIGWKGHLFIPGRSGGAASVAGLVERLASVPLAQAVADVRGVYGLFVHDAVANTWQVTTDHAGLYQIYHDGRGASTGFLDLLADRGIGPEALRLDKAVEYLAHGAIFDTQTLIEGVRRLAYDEVLTLAPDRPPALGKKTLPIAPEPADTIVPDTIQDMVRSLEGRRLSADVTGGFDSRLVACLMREAGATFEAAVSGIPGTPDTEIAKDVAAMLDCPFHLSQHDLEDLENGLEQVFLAGDGLTDPRRFHRDYANARARRARGVEVLVHGGAGEMFKDQFSLQDFPFYGVKRVNLERFYALRVTPVVWPRKDFAPEAAKLFDDLPRRTIATFAGLREETNNATYNRIYFYLRSPDLYGRFYTNYINMGLDVVAPFLDRDVAHAAIRLPPWRSFFTRWHRDVLTAHCPKLAALPTADGYTASSTWAHLPRNLVGYGVYQARRGAKKVSQKLTGKSRFHAAGAFVADADGFMQALRASPQFARALNALQRANVLRPNLDPAAVRDIHVGRVMAVGRLLDHLGAQSRRRAEDRDGGTEPSERRLTMSRTG